MSDQFLYRHFVMALLCWAAFMEGVSAQPAPDRVYRVGFISVSQGSLESFRQDAMPELARRGFVEGRNLQLETRFGEPNAIPALARDLVRAHPDVIVAVSNSVVHAVASAAPGVAIVASYFGSDPVAEGMAQSLARPGGRITGIAMLAEALDAKRLDILHETFPTMRRVAVLSGRPPRNEASIEAMRATAQRLGVELIVIEADSPREYAPAFERMRAARAEALVVISAPDFNRDAAILAQAAAAAGLPTICEWRDMAERGCLLSYGPIKEQLMRRVAAYVVQILRGTPPGELPIETPTHFEFVVNKKTAASLGVDLPPETLIRADEVIE